MNALFKKVTTDKIIRYGSLTSGFFFLADIVYLIFFYRSLPPFLPLFNQMPWGELRLGDKPMIFLPIALTGSISILNFFFSMQLYEQMPLLARMVTITTLLINLITFIFLFRISQLVL